MAKINKDRVSRRKRRVSANILGTKKIPRVSPFMSNRFTYAQLIDDIDRVTLVSFSSLKLSKSRGENKTKKVEEAKKVGLELATKAKKLGILKAVFDRGEYAYKGRIKALAEGLREGGIEI